MLTYAYTDIVILILILFYAISGWKKGLLRSLLGPFSLVACIILSIVYYHSTKNIPLSLGIGVLGPFFLNGILSLILMLFRKAVQGDDKGPSLLSALGGSLLNVGWSGGLLLISLYLFMRIPPDIFNIGLLREDVEKSMSYAVTTALMDAAFPQWKAQPGGTQRVKEELRDTEEYKRLMANEKVRALMEDPEVLRQIQSKDFTKLLKNPKLYEVMQDPATIQDFLKLNQKYLQQQALPMMSPKQEDAQDTADASSP